MHALIPFCTSIESPSFYQDFMQGMEEALAEMGHSSERFAFAEIGVLSQQELERFFNWARSARCDLVLDLCCWGFALSRVKWWDGQPEAGATLFDSLGARYVALMFDQPFFQPAAALLSNALLLCHPDRGHAELMRSLYPAFHPHAMLFVPPATRAENRRAPERWRERHIPLLYAGNLAPDALEPFWADVPQRQLYDGAADLLDAHTELPLHRAIEQVRGSLDLELDLEPRLEVHRTLEYFLRHRLRHKLIMSLAASGLQIEVYGRGWDALALPANVRTHPPVDYRTYLDLIGATRVCLDASTYLGGANDRVVQFAVNGTVFFSNAQAYLREAFDDAAEFYTPLDLGAAAERIAYLLAHGEELEARSLRLHEIALKDHLWRHRLESIFKAMP